MHGRIISIDDTWYINENKFFTCHGTMQLYLNLQVLQSEDNYISCRVLSAITLEEIFSFEFDHGVSIAGIDQNMFIAHCLQFVGFPCEGGKMCATAYGLSTCELSFPSCPKCMWSLLDRVAPS